MTKAQGAAYVFLIFVIVAVAVATMFGKKPPATLPPERYCLQSDRGTVGYPTLLASSDGDPWSCYWNDSWYCVRMRRVTCTGAP